MIFFVYLIVVVFFVSIIYSYSFTQSNSGNMTNNHPSIKWGQKKDLILLTIAVQDIEKPEINIESTKLHFKGQQTKGLIYDTTLEFFDEIDPKVSKYRKTSQNHWEFMLKKKDSKKPFWKRLIKSTEKCQWINIDWNHFNTEDEDDDDDLGGLGGKDWSNIDEMLKQTNNKSPTDLNDLEETDTDGDDDDDDDEPLPDLEENSKSDEKLST